MTLLLVDDDRGFRERMARALGVRGHTVVEAGSAVAAIAAVCGHDFAGVVVDLRLSDPDGRDGLWLIRELHLLRPALALVVLTGFGSIATALEAVRLGARDYLTKPADPEQLLAALRGERPLRDNPKEIPPEVPSLDRIEWEHIERTLADCGGNISQTARLLGLDRRTLQRKLARFPPRR